MTPTSFGRGWLRHAVLAWTALLSVFLWTSLNRAVWRPEIATWAGFGLEGRGPGAWTWVAAAAALVAGFLFYLEGRGRRRALFHAILIAVHLPLTAYLTYLVVAMGPDAAFHGDTWGWRVPLSVLLVPFLAFTVLAVALVVRERVGTSPPRRPWSDVDGRALLLAVALTPVIAVSFGSGSEFDTRARIATALAVLQWLLLISALQHAPRAANTQPSRN